MENMTKNFRVEKLDLRKARLQGYTKYLVMNVYFILCNGGEE